MHDRSDDDALIILVIEHDVRLKSKPPVPGLEAVSALPDPWKVGEQSKGPLKPGQVGVGLISAELGFAVVVDCYELRSGPLGKTEASHRDATRPAPEPQPERRSWLRS